MFSFDCSFKLMSYPRRSLSLHFITLIGIFSDIIECIVLVKISAISSEFKPEKAVLLSTAFKLALIFSTLALPYSQTVLTYGGGGGREILILPYIS